MLICIKKHTLCETKIAMYVCTPKYKMYKQATGMDTLFLTKNGEKLQHLGPTYAAHIRKNPIPPPGYQADWCGFLFFGFFALYFNYLF